MNINDKIIPTDGCWLKSENIKKIEKIKASNYMGYWTTKSPSGGWNDSPVDVFYVENPDISLGHTNYFGIFYRGDKLYINEASTAFSEPIIVCETPDKSIIVSRYRHDYVTHQGCTLDGGRSYIRRSLEGNFYEMTVEGPNFIIKDYNYE